MIPAEVRKGHTDEEASLTAKAAIQTETVDVDDQMKIQTGGGDQQSRLTVLVMRSDDVFLRSETSAGREDTIRQDEILTHEEVV
jgi:hypothetical protein